MTFKTDNVSAECCNPSHHSPWSLCTEPLTSFRFFCPTRGNRYTYIVMPASTRCRGLSSYLYCISNSQDLLSCRWRAPCFRCAHDPISTVSPLCATMLAAWKSGTLQLIMSLPTPPLFLFVLFHTDHSCVRSARSRCSVSSTVKQRMGREKWLTGILKPWLLSGTRCCVICSTFPHHWEVSICSPKPVPPTTPIMTDLVRVEFCKPSTPTVRPGTSQTHRSCP